MSKIKHKIAIISGKGGVGKSTVAVNIAATLAKKGYRVGILDADVHGPSVPRLLGLTGRQMKTGPPGAFPVLNPQGIRVVSMDFILPEEKTPTIWRGPLKIKAIRQLLTDIVWGELDFLIIDLPPGTGDEALSIAQLLPEIDGAIIITIPSDLSRAVVRKSITFTERMNIRVLGIIENMSAFVCPTCGDRFAIFQKGAGKNWQKKQTYPSSEKSQ